MEASRKANNTRTTLLLIGVVTVVLCVLAGLWALSLPWWYGAVFLAAIPVYYLALRALAAYMLKRFEAGVRSLVARKADRFQLPQTHSAAAVVRWYYREDQLLERIASIYDAHDDPANAARFYHKAHEAAPDAYRPVLARLAWERHRKAGEEASPLSVDDTIDVLESASQERGAAREPIHSALGALLVAHRKDFEGAKAAYERALAASPTDGRRFKAICQLGHVAALQGLYGAADGYMSEARDVMPSGDPGYQAFYGRMMRKIDTLKRLKSNAVVNLAAMIEGPTEITPASPLPEAPEEEE